METLKNWGPRVQLEQIFERVHAHDLARKLIYALTKTSSGQTSLVAIKTANQ